MKIYAWVKPDAKTEEIQQINENHFIIWTKQPAQEDKANAAAIKILAEFLKIPPSCISLKHGRHFKEKVFEVE